MSPRGTSAEYACLPEFAFDAEAIDNGEPDPFDRFSFELSYRRAKRGIDAGGLTGPDIPNAYRNPDSSKTGSGDWNAEISDSDDDALRHTMSCVVHEVIHEGLEWLRLDGEILLDPHGKHELAIRDAVGACVARLLPLALDAYQSRSGRGSYLTAGYEDGAA